jgi:hypothetical protein
MLDWCGRGPCIKTLRQLWVCHVYPFVLVIAVVCIMDPKLPTLYPHLCVGPTTREEEATRLLQ